MPSIDIISKGLWSSETELVFCQNNLKPSASSFEVIPNGSKTLTVPVTSLDTFFTGKSMRELPTYIKMDIEGAEKEALLGAANIIKQAKPKLAICAYHKPEDIYELLRTILSIRDDYRFALRQHYHGFCDTILYAV